MIARLGRLLRRAVRPRDGYDGRAVWLAGALIVSSASGAYAQLVSRLPIERVIAGLHASDAHARVEAAEALAVTGPSARVVPPLVEALGAEAVPEVRSALIVALARRGDATAVSALVGAWVRASPDDRVYLLDGLAATETSEALTFVADQLESEVARPAACARLARTDAGLAIVMTNLGVAERRDAAALCLAQLVHVPRAAAALLAALPSLRPSVLARALEALDGDPGVIEPALSALAAGDPIVVPAALGVLARRAPARVPLERWRTLANEESASRPSAIVALTSEDPAAAEAAITSVAAAGGPGRAALLDALLDAPSASARWIAAFVTADVTRARALDGLARLAGGAEVLAGLPAAPDVTLALALAGAHDPEALRSLRSRLGELDAETRVVLLAIAGVADAGACTLEGETIERRRATAFCLSRAANGAELATRLLETEREPTVVAWLALATREPPSTRALDELLALDRTRLAILHLVPRAIERASPPEGRRLRSALVHAARATAASERAEAIRAIATLADPRHRALVASALDDEAPSVRVAAVHALARYPVEPVSEIRRAGRARVEHDDDVRAAFDVAAIALADAPLLVRVDVHGEGATPSEVELRLADGRSLVLAPVEGQIVLFGVPDRPAHVRLVDPERD